jgi:cytochrome c peroxidase
MKQTGLKKIHFNPVALAGIFFLLGLTFAGFAQTNVPATNPPAATAVWDYADQLDFTVEQRATAQRIRAALEAARNELEAAIVTNTPPDAQRAARLNYSQQLRALRTELAGLLTEEQKKKYEVLRPTRRPQRLAAVITNSPVAVAQTPAEGEEGNPGELGRSPVKTRPALTGEENQKLAAELRAAYARPSAQWPAPNLDDEVKPLFNEIGLLPPVKFPTNNPYTDAKAELGKKLFFDPRLSGSGQIACASCHDPDIGWADSRTVSFGHGRKVLKRNAPTILNVGHSQTLFWDGRADSLEEQSIAVMNNEEEMRGSAESVRENLLAIHGYTNEFAAAFGSPDISIGLVGKAIATFERTITSRGNAFDTFLRGNTNALSDSAVRGLHLFRTAARCINCHNGPNFTDGRFHNEGLTYYGRKFEDLGRYAVTHSAGDVGAFKTPTLRNISNTRPYMHNGLFELDGVLAMYNAGMPNVRPSPKQKDDPLFPKKSPLLKPLGLNTQDIADLKAFLESLGEARFRVRPPENL